MSFFYNLNQKLAALAAKQDARQVSEDVKAAAPKSKLAESMDVAEAGYSVKAGRAGKDLGKPGKNFAKIAKTAGKEYGSKAAGERVAGAVLNKLRHPTEGNEFTGNLAKAKAQHKDEFEVDGKKYKVVEADPTGLGEGTCPSCHCNPCECVEEGNAFTGKLKATPKGGKFKLGDKEFKDTSSLEEQEMDEGYAEMDAWLKSREKEKGTGRFDKKKISTGTVYTRKPETFDDPETDPEATGGAPKRKGRPAGTKRAIGAKHSGRSKLARKDAIAECDPEEYDQEGDMAKDNLETMVMAAKELHSILGDNDNLPEWVQAKITKALDYINASNDYIQSEKRDGYDDEEVAEVAPPGAKAERMVKHIKKSLSKDGKLSDKDKAIAYATTWKAKKAGKVEEEGSKPDFLDVDKDGDKKETFKKAVADKKEEKVDETTTSGSVATATNTPKKSKGGMQFGKGVYESLDSKLENMITESMNVIVNMSTDEQGQSQKSITVTATDKDADKLAELLKMAGLEQKQETCSVCGEANCGCDSEVVDENSPDWPTNKETLAAQPELRTYSGGLNGPKSTGQTTVPVVASQLRRTSTMEENVELERTLFKTWKNYKG